MICEAVSDRRLYQPLLPYRSNIVRVAGEARIGQRLAKSSPNLCPILTSPAFKAIFFEIGFPNAASLLL